MRESRREFLKKSGCALGMATLATQMQHFGMMSALAQKVDESDAKTEGGANYKALVLVFMAGGADGNNMVIPNHNSGTSHTYNMYAAARSAQGLAIAQGSLLPFNVPAMGGLSFGFHPSLGPGATNAINNGIHELWGLGKLAVVTNVGSLVRPMTKAQYQNNTIQKPYQLFSHSDQVSQYQTSISNTQSFTGWGGRMSDKMTAGNNPSALIPTITSINGAQLFTAGQMTLPMAIAAANNTGTPNLANVLNPQGFSTSTANQARLAAFNQLRTVDLESNYVAAASNVTDLAISANTALQTSQEVTATFPNTSIGLQLKQVARLVKKRFDLNVNRQIFYCQIGGWDTHNGQLGDQVNLFSQLGQAMRAFYDEMGVQGVSNDVTTFTMSDFGRTLNPAGTGAGTVGSDHAWGNHVMVMGGSVLGGDFYGMPTSNGTPFPSLIIGASGPDDTDSNSGARGRWIPTTSVDQYAATLARWFGLQQADQTAVFPNIGNFASSNLGFLP
ncbi:MAG: DUF1501 domain-containing protein [Pyrinomonadaceae bacterium]